ncbi:hypothetical protein [Caldicellulosiruptor bescii]|uniref:hypothetical protein n=1 Tax=Caldicellulosiruptor bescii TaxID=31899 RepID=UPI00031F4B89|nr:hypothetical protein [Caldicellulosiruptor bescii]
MKLNKEAVQDVKLNSIKWYRQLWFDDSNESLPERFNGWLEKKVLEYIKNYTTSCYHK